MARGKMKAGEKGRRASGCFDGNSCSETELWPKFENLTWPLKAPRDAVLLLYIRGEIEETARQEESRGGLVRTMTACRRAVREMARGRCYAFARGRVSSRWLVKPAYRQSEICSAKPCLDYSHSHLVHCACPTCTIRLILIGSGILVISPGSVKERKSAWIWRASCSLAL